MVMMMDKKKFLWTLQCGYDGSGSSGGGGGAEHPFVRCSCVSLQPHLSIQRYFLQVTLTRVDGTVKERVREYEQGWLQTHGMLNVTVIKVDMRMSCCMLHKSTYNPVICRDECFCWFCLWWLGSGGVWGLAQLDYYSPCLVQRQQQQQQTPSSQASPEDTKQDAHASPTNRFPALHCFGTVWRRAIGCMKPPFANIMPCIAVQCIVCMVHSDWLCAPTPK